MDIEKHYEDAKRNPEVRQDFLQEVDLEDYAQYVSKVVYNKDESENIMTTLHKPTILFYRFPSKIEVSENAFDLYTWPDFYNLIVHHEGFHAKQWRDNSMGWPEILYKVIASECFDLEDELNIRGFKREQEAYSNQIKHSSFKYCSDWFKEDIISDLIIYEDALRMLKQK